MDSEKRHVIIKQPQNTDQTKGEIVTFITTMQEGEASSYLPFTAEPKALGAA